MGEVEPIRRSEARHSDARGLGGGLLAAPRLPLTAACLLVAALALGGRSGVHLAHGSPGRSVEITLLLIVLAVDAVGLLALIVAALAGFEGTGAVWSRPNVATGRRWARLLGAAVAYGVIELIVWRLMHGRTGQTIPYTPHDSRPAPATTGTSSGSPGSGTALVITALVAAAALALLALLLWHRTRPGHPAPPATPTPAPAAPAPPASSPAPSPGPGADVREAVIACYLALESRLVSAGLPRRPSETAGEYVRRALPTGPRRTAATRLVVLYEEARFSDHPLPTPHRALAQSALTTATPPP